MRILNPELATWLLAVPLAFLFWFLHAAAKHRFRRRASLDERLGRISRLSTHWRDFAALAAAIVALAALAAAVLRIQVRVETRTPDHEREDLVIVLDRSASMHAEDILPSRFGRAVEEIKAFLLQKPEGLDRVGLVGFAGTSLVLSHLTRDVDALFFYLDWIEEDEEPHFGTDIGVALATARDLIAKDGKPTRKILLVISDGDDQGGSLDEVLRTLREERTRVYTVGIGSERDVPIPAGGQTGRRRFLEDDRGAQLTARFGETTLKTIANVTGGRYSRSTTGSELAEAMREAVGRERRQTGWSTSVQYHDVYPYALAAAAAALFVLLVAL